MLAHALACMTLTGVPDPVDLNLAPDLHDTTVVPDFCSR
jgi:hypothetical protein